MSSETGCIAGGLLVVFPGRNASPADYGAWRILPGTPASVTEVPLALRRRTLAWDQPLHPLVRPLREDAGVPALTVRRALRWNSLHPDTVRLVSMGSGRPFLLERPLADGRVLMCAVAADRTWSDFPLSPFYLPLVARCLDHGAGLEARAPNHPAAGPLALDGILPAIPPGARLSGPGHASIPIRRTVRDGRTRHFVEDLAVPGIYELAEPARLDTAPVLAINLPRRESDLTPLPPGAVAGRLGIERLHLARDPESLARLVRDHRVGRSYSEHLLWTAFALVVLEFFLANLLLHRSGTPAARIGIDPAGQLHQPTA